MVCLARDPDRPPKVRKIRLLPNCGIGKDDACYRRNCSIGTITTWPDYCGLVRPVSPPVDWWVHGGVGVIVAVSLPQADRIHLLNIGAPTDSSHSGVAPYTALAVDLRGVAGLVGVVGSHFTPFPLVWIAKFWPSRRHAETTVAVTTSSTMIRALVAGAVMARYLLVRGVR